MEGVDPHVQGACRIHRDELRERVADDDQQHYPVAGIVKIGDPLLRRRCSHGQWGKFAHYD